MTSARVITTDLKGGLVVKSLSSQNLLSSAQKNNLST